jgi:hypothetical protein
MKLPKAERLPNRTDLNKSSSRGTALELFDYFCNFFVRFDRTELQNELNMMHSGDEDDVFGLVDQ